jgi:hypothetical protein
VPVNLDNSGIAGRRLAEPDILLRGMLIVGNINETIREDNNMYLLVRKKVSLLKKAK